MSPVSKILKTSILLGLVFMVTNSSAEVVTTDVTTSTTPPPKDLLMIKWCNCIEERNATSKHNQTKYSTLALTCNYKALEWGAYEDIHSWILRTDVMNSQPNCTARNAAKGDVDFAKDAGGLPIWIIVLIALGALLFASVLLFVVYRYMRASKGIAFLLPSSTNVGVPANVANGTPSNNKTQVEMDNIEKKP